MSASDDFRRLVRALSPWREQLVFIGGWAHQMYRLHPDAEAMSYEALTTRDADVAFGDRQRFEGSLLERLEAAGFKEELMGDHHPPISRYVLGEESSTGFYAEFLTPLIGSKSDRTGRTKLTIEQGKVTAQKLRYLDLLFVRPWEVHLPAEEQTKEVMRLQIPNPVAFVAQKFLIYPERTPAKRAQDILYIHDTLELFAHRLPLLAELWREAVRPSLEASRWLERLQQMKTRVLAESNDAVRDAARIRPDRQLEPESIRRFCLAAFDEIIG